MWANAILYLEDSGHGRAVAAYEEIVLDESAPDWLQLFARVGVTIDPLELTRWLKEQPDRNPDHLEELDAVRRRLIDGRRQRKSGRAADVS
jgi:hypothetical protein